MSIYPTNINVKSIDLGKRSGRYVKIEEKGVLKKSHLISVNEYLLMIRQYFDKKQKHISGDFKNGLVDGAEVCQSPITKSIINKYQSFETNKKEIDKELLKKPSWYRTATKIKSHFGFLSFCFNNFGFLKFLKALFFIETAASWREEVKKVINRNIQNTKPIGETLKAIKDKIDKDNRYDGEQMKLRRTKNLLHGVAEQQREKSSKNHLRTYSGRNSIYLKYEKPNKKLARARILKDNEFSTKEDPILIKEDYCDLKIQKGDAYYKSYNNKNVEVSIATTTGRRKQQQDRFTAGRILFEYGGKNYEAQISGVFDGHGGLKRSNDGDGVAQFLKENLRTLIEEKLSENLRKNMPLDAAIVYTLKNIFSDIDEEIKKQALESLSDYSDEAYEKFVKSGSTATISLLLNKRLYIANVGDSIAIVCDKKGRNLRLTDEAKLSNERYAKKVPEDKVINVDGTNRVSNDKNTHLGITRTIGFFEDENALKKGESVFSAKSKVSYVDLPTNEEVILFLATDGIYPITSGFLGKTMPFLKNVELSKIVKSLVWASLFLGSKDNITVLAMKC